MNTTDLRNLLAEHAGTGAPNPATDVRVAGALDRARSIHRRRRITAGATALAVTAVAVAVITVPPLVTAPEPLPEPAEELNEHGLPLYDRGHELIASGVIRAGERTVSVTAVPSAFPLVVATQCGEDRIYGEEEETPEVNIELSVGEQVFTSSGGSCGYGLNSNDADGWAEWGVRPDEAATFTATTDQPVTAETEVAMGIYQAVPWDEYPFPPRPDELPDLPPPAMQVDDVLNSDPDDPNAPREFVLDHAVVSIDLVAQSPGILRLRIDGVEVDPIYSWDYGYRPLLSLRWPPFNEDMRPGEPPIRLEVQPEGFTGAWVLHVSEL